MTRQEKINLAQELENKIVELRRFMDILKTQDTIDKVFWNGLKSCIKIRKQYFLFGIFSYVKKVELEIPETIRIEIAAKCEVWLKELEEEANKQLSPN